VQDEVDALMECFTRLRKRKLKVAVVGIPKTIDNDIAIIDRSFGFDTAVAVLSHFFALLHTSRFRFALKCLYLASARSDSSPSLITIHTYIFDSSAGGDQVSLVRRRRVRLLCERGLHRSGTNSIAYHVYE
jgi:hypothetical protein